MFFCVSDRDRCMQLLTQLFFRPIMYHDTAPVAAAMTITFDPKRVRNKKMLHHKKTTLYIFPKPVVALPLPPPVASPLI